MKCKKSGDVVIFTHVRIAYYLGVSLILASMAGGQFIPELRYLKYAVPGFFFIIWLNYDPSRIYMRSYLKPFLLLLAYCFLTIPIMGVDGYKDASFILTYIFFFLLFPELKVSLTRLNVILMGLFLLVELSAHGSAIVLIVTNALGANGAGGLEQAEFGFIFGLFAIYFLAVRRNNLLAILNILFCLMSMKRIAVLAVLMVVMLMLMPKKVVEKILSPRFMLCVNVGIVMVLILFTQGDFDDLIYTLTGLSANAFAMGRQVLYWDVVGVISNGNWFGSGVGVAYAFALEAAGSAAGGNLHSDLIKVVFEYGWIIYAMFIVLMYKSENILVKYFVLYLNILFISDNVLIYVSVMFFFLLIVSQVRMDLSSVDEVRKSSKTIEGSCK